MASTPNWKIYSPAGEYIASCKYREDAAALVAFNGNGSSIRFASMRAKKDSLWVEGKEEFPAHESYDRVSDILLERLREKTSHSGRGISAGEY